MSNFIYDGIEQLSGISGANPVVVPRNLASNAVNRCFRYDENNTRPGFREIELIYVDDTNNKNKFLLEGGNIQGSYFYNSYPSFQTSYIILSVAGTIFTVQIQGKKGYVRKLFTGNDPVFTHAWFAQGFEWLVIQDGQSQPILWDGTNSARRAVKANSEVPVGSVMAFIHGRLLVSSSDGTNQIAAGDIVYGSKATDTSDIIKFTETEYWAEGGAFGLPVFIGNIMGIQAMPYLDTGTGQNEAVVLGTEGAVALNVSGPRDTWLDNQLIRISLIGSGCVSAHSLATMNGELFFRSAEGVRAYRNARAEFNQSWKQTPISSDVRRWLSKDNRRLLQYCSQASWENFLFTTCSPQIEAANNPLAGHHRFHRGFCVLDAEPESNTLRAGSSVWHGMWTGIRPVCFVEGRIDNAHRAFAWSYDRDGVNRLYEITKDDLNDTWQGSKRKIFSFFDTGNLGVIERVANNFDGKKLTGGEIELSKLKEEVEVEVHYRPDNSECFVDMDAFNVGCDCVVDSECNQFFTQPRSARKILKSPPSECVPGTAQPAQFIYHTQARVLLTGGARVDRMRLRFSRHDASERVDCLPANCDPIDCCPGENDFSYHIAPEGENTNIPEIENPSQVEVYEATKQVTAVCPPGATGTPKTVTRTATSGISYEDALKKATAAALADATALLECENCETSTIISFVVRGTTVDLSALFAAGSYGQDYYGRPWRLIETVTDIEYATGLVDGTGTLIILWTLPGYSSYFDIGTYSFVDQGTTDAYMELQVGCPTTSVGTNWPEPSPPAPACVDGPISDFITNGDNPEWDISSLFEEGALSDLYNGASWSIRESSFGVSYATGTVTNGALVTEATTPSVYGSFDSVTHIFTSVESYNGFMEVTITCPEEA